MKKFEISALFLVIMGALGIVEAALLTLLLYDAWQNFEDPFPTIIYLPLSIVFTVFLFALSSNLHKKRSWAWHVGFWFFLLFTIGDLVVIFHSGIDLIMVLIAAFHGAGAYLLYVDKPAFFPPEGKGQAIAGEDQQQTTVVQRS